MFGLIALPQVGDEETIVKPSFWERVVIFFNLITGMGIYNSFSKLDFSQAEKIVVLGDVWQEESMLVQYANDKGIASVTCQHALFIPSIGNSTYDILNMWMVKAKTALLWGQYTEEQYRNFNPNLKCEICGNPTITEKKYHENAAIIGIAMDLPRMHEYNQKMIDVVEGYARNTSRKVRLRIHPADKKENYRVDSKICEFSSDLDTLGIMYQHDMRRFFYLIDNNLAKNICLGFHSHNNLQMSFANAQEMIRLNHQRTIIIDSSCYGMGRGVGNLCTELLTDYINSNIGQRYSMLPVLNIVDKFLMPIYAEHRWGYDLPYFLAATVKCHPNYAAYLLRKETLSIEKIEKLLSLIPLENRAEFDSELIEEMYVNMQS